MKSTTIAKSLLSIGVCIAFFAVIVFIFRPDSTNIKLENNGDSQKITGSSDSAKNIIDLEDAQNYYIDTSFIDVHLNSSENETAYAIYKGKHDMNITASVDIDNGYYLIKLAPTDAINNLGAIFDHSDLYIYLPNRELSTVHIESFAAKINVENINVDKLVTDIDATDLELENCNITNAELQAFASDSDIVLNNSLISANLEVTAGNLDLTLPENNFSFEGYSTSFLSDTEYSSVFKSKGNLKKDGLLEQIAKVNYNNSNDTNAIIADVTTEVTFGKIDIDHN